MNNDAIILLSGGLDSTVSLAVAKKNYNVKLALIFDYGQKAFVRERIAAEKVAEFYDIKPHIISLPWLKDISRAALIDKSSDIPAVKSADLLDKEKMLQTMKNVWIPNRNSLFLNIAASFCDSLEIKNIIIGANLEEASTFSDNSSDFISAENSVFEFSTLVKPKVIAPLIKMTKTEIISEGYNLKIPFEYIYSCYLGTDKHCGKCESCQRLKRGLERLGLFDILNMLFVE